MRLARRARELSYVEWLSRTAYVIYTLVFFGVVVSLLCFAFIVHYRKTRLLQLAQRSVLIMIVSCTLCMSLSLFLFLGEARGAAPRAAPRGGRTAGGCA